MKNQERWRTKKKQEAKITLKSEDKLLRVFYLKEQKRSSEDRAQHLAATSGGQVDLLQSEEADLEGSL